MSVHWMCSQLPLTQKEIDGLWQTTLSLRSAEDQEVSIRCVDLKEMQGLNMQYKKKDTPTNVLTFSYGDGTHDIALCAEVAQQESIAQKAELRDYVALLVVHAFLHSLGMDHELSAEEAQAQNEAEKKILEQQGFIPTSLVAHS